MVTIFHDKNIWVSNSVILLLQKKWAMIHDNIFRDTKPSDDMVKEKSNNSFDIVWIGWHGLSPFTEIVENHDYVMMANCGWRFASHKINTPFCERADCNYEVEWSRGRTFVLWENLERVAFFDGVDTIFKYLGTKKPVWGIFCAVAMLGRWSPHAHKW